MAGVVGQGREQAEQEASTGESLRSLGWPQSKLLQCHHSRPHPWSLVGRQEALWGQEEAQSLIPLPQGEEQSRSDHCPLPWLLCDTPLSPRPLPWPC